MTSSAHAASPSRESSAGTPNAAMPIGSGFRPEIQALRAVAVLSVIGYHFWPSRVPGGYVGVDVFFAISGYLIIGHLLREVERSGRIDLLGFWSRRARRLLPASLLVLVVTGIAILVWVPQVYWLQDLREVGASAIYVQNWLLGFEAIDYLGAANVASPVQHFWSLSVEEQFYIAWPVIIIAVLAVLRASRRVPMARATLGAVLTVLTVGGLAYSIYLTAVDPAFAYFATTTRAWEFAVGGVLAWVMMRHSVRNATLAAMLGWVGAAMIVVSILAYTSGTPFPGVAAALPVVGTLLVIAGGLPDRRWALSFVFRLRPVQWIGDISYSLYLWHWPFLILAPFVLDTQLGNAQKLLLLATVFVVAWASKRFVEDPFRFAGGGAIRPWRLVLSAVVASALICGLTLIGTGVLQTRIETARAQTLELLADGTSCVGAAAFGPSSDCPQPFAVTALTDPALAAQDIGKGVRVEDQCKQSVTDSAVVTCELGDVDSPVRTIALIGDSHAGQFLEPLQIYAEQNSWKVITYLKSWCIGTAQEDVAAPDSANQEGVTSCAEWGDAALDQITSDPQIDAVVFANFTQRYSEGIDPVLGRAVTENDFRAAWTRVEQSGKKVIIIRDPPNAGAINAPSCVAQHLSEYDPCATPLAVAVPVTDPQWSAAQADPAAGRVDLTGYFCDAEDCHTVIGGLIVYFDAHHLAATYARTLAPFLGAAIAAELPEEGSG